VLIWEKVTASFIAAIIPEHVQSLFLIEALGGAMEAGKHSPEQILQSYQSLKSLSGKIPKAYANRKEAAIARKNGITKMFNGTRWISYEACYELTERCCVPHPTGETGKIAFSHDPLLRQPSPFSLSEEANQQVLKKISCPFEVVRGTQGLRHGYWDQRLAFMKANNPRFRVHYVEGHHHVHMENPKPIAEIYIEFIKRNKNEATKSKL
jgi:pimeloyl-ACP methyl ester carboxylesterase